MNMYNFFNVIMKVNHICKCKLPPNALLKLLNKTFPLSLKELLRSSQHKEVHFLRNTITHPESKIMKAFTKNMTNIFC